MNFLFILLATAAIALLALSGIVLLFYRGHHINKLLLGFVALSAGAMLGNALFHLLPEAIEMSEGGRISLFGSMLLVALAFILSFLLEQIFSWHHCHTASHHAGEEPHPHCEREIQPYSRLVLLSDAVHNFMDGIIIAASFIVSPALGVTTAIAIALHEIPQELGDFAVLVHGGYTKRRALFLNFLSALTVVVGGVVGYFVTSASELAVPVLLPFAAGSFLYIAASDLLPELKHEEKLTKTLLHFAIFLIGVAIMAVTALAE